MSYRLHVWYINFREYTGGIFWCLVEIPWSRCHALCKVVLTGVSLNYPSPPDIHAYYCILLLLNAVGNGQFISLHYVDAGSQSLLFSESWVLTQMN